MNLVAINYVAQGMDENSEDEVEGKEEEVDQEPAGTGQPRSFTCLTQKYTLFWHTRQDRRGVNTRARRFRIY